MKLVRKNNPRQIETVRQIDSSQNCISLKIMYTLYRHSDMNTCVYIHMRSAVIKYVHIYVLSVHRYKRTRSPVTGAAVRK